MGLFFAVLVSVSIYVILAVSYDLVLGYGGLFSIAHAAFFATGAYGMAILTTKDHLPVIVAAAVGVGMSAFLSLVLGYLSVRISNDYLVIVSFGFQTVFIALVTNLTSITGGVLGVSTIPPLRLFGLSFSSAASCAYAYLVPASIVVALVWWLARSPFGRALRAIRDNVVAAEALGKNGLRFRLWTFAVAGAFAGVAGVMYAAYVGYISPDAFGNDVNILIFAMVIIGGVGTIVGPFLGAVLLVVVPTLLTFLPLSTTYFAPAEQAIYGLLLVVFMLAGSGGIYGAAVSAWNWAGSRGRLLGSTR